MSNIGRKEILRGVIENYFFKQKVVSPSLVPERSGEPIANQGYAPLFQEGGTMDDAFPCVGRGLLRYQGIDVPSTIAVFVAKNSCSKRTRFVMDSPPEFGEESSVDLSHGTDAQTSFRFWFGHRVLLNQVDFLSFLSVELQTKPLHFLSISSQTKRGSSKVCIE